MGQNLQWFGWVENLVVEQAKDLETCQTFDGINHRNLISIQKQFFEERELWDWCNVFNHVETEIQLPQSSQLANTENIFD